MNTFFLCISLGLCFLMFVSFYRCLMGPTILDRLIGVNAVDYSGYPDCRPEFIRAFETMANLATKTGLTGETALKIRTPLIRLSKAQIIETGTRLGVDYGLTISCYDPDTQGRSCGHCDSCLHRIKGFEEAGIPDPTIYS